MIILVNSENVVIAKGQTAEAVSNGIQVDGGRTYSTHLNLTIKEIPDGTEVIQQKHCYFDSIGVYNNPDYVEYKTPEQRITELEQIVADLAELQVPLEV